MQSRNESAGDPVIARDATYHRTPDALRARLRDSLAQVAREQRSSLPWRTFALGAACGVAAMLAWNVALLQWNSRGDEAIERDILAAHLRSVIADGHLTDVVSSDQHAVNPGSPASSISPLPCATFPRRASRSRADGSTTSAASPLPRLSIATACTR
jgi:hypothetical protein